MNLLSLPTKHHQLHCHLCFYRGRNSPRFPQQDKMWETCASSLQPRCLTVSQEGQCQQMRPQGRLLSHLSWWQGGSWAAGRDPSDAATIHPASQPTQLWESKGEAAKQDWGTLSQCIFGRLTVPSKSRREKWILWVSQKEQQKLTTLKDVHGYIFHVYKKCSWSLRPSV